MQQIHSPKPKMFGEGYGKHISYNFKLMKQLFWLGWKMMANMFIPGVFYETAHWEIIDLYHKMRGFRHGTISDHRCKECGGELFSSDEMHRERDELKQLEIRMRLIDACNEKLDKLRAEPDMPSTRMSEEEKEEILELMDKITPEEVEAYMSEMEKSSDK
jgi:hypothetical protein